MAERIQPSLLSALTDVVRWLDTANVPSMIIGGVAASMLGQPRLTQDVDALAILPEERWAAAMDAAARFGIVPRIENPLDFARRSRVLLMKHIASEIDIDVRSGRSLTQQALQSLASARAVSGPLRPHPHTLRTTP